MADMESMDEMLASFYRQSRAAMTGPVPSFERTAARATRGSWRTQVLAAAAAAVFILAIAAGAHFLRQNQSRPAGQNPVLGSPSPQASASTQPTAASTVFTGSCMLPVSWGDPGRAKPLGGGLVTFPGAAFAADPAASGLATPFGSAWVTYDLPMRRWVPVNREMLSPDGTIWLYGTLRSGNEYHAVGVLSGTDTTLWGSDKSFRVFGLDNKAAFAMLDSPTGAHLWRIPLDGSAGSQIKVNGIWQFVNRGAAWGTGSQTLPAGAPFTLQRLDLQNNTVVTWLQLPGPGSLVGFDGAGAPIVQTGGPGADVIVAPRPGVQSPVAAGFTFAAGPSAYAPLPSLGDGHGIWLAGTDGIYLSVNGVASKQSSVQAFPAGPCA